MTPQQKGIVQLLAEGRPIKEIADVLAISEKTVEFHKHHIRESWHSRHSLVCLKARIDLEQALNVPAVVMLGILPVAWRPD